MDTTYIHAINVTNVISMNNDDNAIEKHYVPLFLPNYHEDVYSGSVYDFAK